MNAMAEGKMAVRGALHIEDLGIGEFSFVAIGRSQAERNEFSSLNVLSQELLLSTLRDLKIDRSIFIGPSTPICQQDERE